MTELSPEPALDLEHFRTLLREEQARLEQQLRRIQSLNQGANLAGESSELADYDEHDADLGTTTFQREQDQAILRDLHDQLHQVRHALLRIQDGTYGRCERCGRPIDPERLEVLPYATLCIEDADWIEGQW